MVLLRFISDWKRRLVRARELAADEGCGNSWLWLIRARVLTYLLSRYPEPKPPAWPPVRKPRRAPFYPQHFCLVEEPVDTPPRSTERLKPLLKDIRQCNRPRRRKPWFLWG